MLGLVSMINDSYFSMTRYLQFLLIVVSSVFVSGCVPIVGSTIAYKSAVSNQEHGAYTDYYFGVLKDNSRRENQGLAPNPITPEDQWVKEYNLRLEYTQYYHDALAANLETNKPFSVLKPIAPFEEWKTNEYKQVLADRAKFV